MATRRKRRKWSDDEKRMICAQTRLPGVSVAQVARRYDVNANQVFNWLKDPQFAARPDDPDVARFLPVEVVEPVQLPHKPEGLLLKGLVVGCKLKIPVGTKNLIGAFAGEYDADGGLGHGGC